MTGQTGSDPLGWIADELAALEAAGLRRPTRVCRVLPGGRVEVDGRELWNFGSNDYLGLAAHHFAAREPEAQAKGSDAAPVGGSELAVTSPPFACASGSRGWGATASPAVCGRSPEVAALERTLAKFEGTEDAVVFPTGYAANLGTVAALTEPGDAVFVERDCHACLVDGAKLGGGRLRVWRRGEVHDLAPRLERAAGARRRWVVTDGVFSMEGDDAPLHLIVDAAERHDAVVICDEAHATGVRGPGGRGVAEAFGFAHHPRVVRTGTLSKAVGAAGGFVSGSRDLCDLLRHAAKSHIFSTALPPAVAATAAANLRWIASPAGASAREALANAARHLQERLTDAFAPARVPPAGGSPILAVRCGTPGAATAMSARLADAGFFVPAIRPPTVPRGTSRLRISLSAAHPPDAVDALGDALIRVVKHAYTLKAAA